MSQNRKANRWRVIAAGTAVVFGLSSCATTGGPGGGNENMGQILGPLGGAALGAAVGAAVGGKYSPLIGAAAGALAGYAAGYAFDSYRVSQKKNAIEVNDEYKKEHNGELPDQTVVTKYMTTTDPAGVVSRGSQLDVVSEIELVKGAKSAGQLDKVDEELLIADANGQNTKRLRKQALSEANNSGAYTTRFTFRPTREVTQGTYPYRTVLYLNDQPVRQSEGAIQVVTVDGQVRVAIVAVRQ
jgi:hypothetical protein